VAVLVFVAAIYLWQWEAARDRTTLTVLPTEGGHAVYVDGGRQGDWLVNCGSDKAVQFMLKDYLHGQGVNRIPRLILTEGAARECGGVSNLDELFGIGTVWTSDVKFRSTDYRDAVARFEKSSRRKILQYGDTLDCWKVLFPFTNTLAKVDDAPLVLMGTFNGMRVLLLSDLSRSGQSELLSATNDLRADIVVAGLPDTGEPLCDDLIAAIQPKAMVIADSEFPATRRAGRGLKERLEQTKIPVVYTRDSGAVGIVTDSRGWKMNAMDGWNCSGRAGFR